MGSGHESDEDTSKNLQPIQYNQWLGALKSGLLEVSTSVRHRKRSGNPESCGQREGVRQACERDAKADRLISRQENGQIFLICSLEPDTGATFVS
jgi:hypothetical protein